VPAVGTFVPAGAPLVRIVGATGPLDRKATVGAVALGPERTLDEDMAYGFRMLVDMAERALSDSPFLDPTTAVQCVDRLHDGLRQLAVRVIPDGRYQDRDGHVRLVVPVMTWDAYVHLAFDEIRLAGAASPQISRRLLAALDDLLTIAPPERRPVLEMQRELLDDAVRELARDQRDVAVALRADQQGLGVSDGMAGDVSRRGVRSPPG
jgi:uncharacterized membrane protein